MFPQINEALTKEVVVLLSPESTAEQREALRPERLSQLHVAKGLWFSTTSEFKAFAKCEYRFHCLALSLFGSQFEPRLPNRCNKRHPDSWQMPIDVGRRGKNGREEEVARRLPTVPVLSRY